MPVKEMNSKVEVVPVPMVWVDPVVKVDAKDAVTPQLLREQARPPPLASDRVTDDAARSTTKSIVAACAWLNAAAPDKASAAMAATCADGVALKKEVNIGSLSSVV